MARRYKSIIYAIHGVQFPDSATPQTLTYQGYATPVGQIFGGYATPVGQIFSGVATPVGQIFYSYATPLYGALPSGGTAGQILTKADSTNYSVYWQTTTPFAGYATPIGQIHLGTGAGLTYNAGTLSVTFPFTGVATPVGQIFYGYATPQFATPFQGYATPLGQVFNNYATPTGQIDGGQLVTGSVQSAKLATPFAGFATPIASAITINSQTNNYTLTLGDVDRLVEVSTPLPVSVTVPLNSATPFPVGAQINILQTGGGQVSLATPSGVTLNGTPGLRLRAQWSSVTVIKRSTNTWVAIGDLSA